MKYTEVISYIKDIELNIGVEANRYRLYSVDKHSYFGDFYPSNHGEVSIYSNPHRFFYSMPKIINIKDYLLKHDGRIYFPAHQKGYRHGIMAQFDLSEVYKTLDIINDLYIEEPSGQLVLSLI